MRSRVRSLFAGKLLRFACALGAIVSLSACGNIAENLLEEGLEEAIERDSGEDIELDFDSGDGQFSVTGADGEEFSINFDGEEGELTIEGSDPNSDEDFNINISEEDGDVLITGEGLDDGDDVNITLTEDDGAVTVTGQNESGEVLNFTSGEEMPDNWPSEVPVPAGQVVSASSFDSGENQVLSLVVEVDDPIRAHDEYVKKLEKIGFTVEGTTATSDGDSKMTFSAVSSPSWNGLVQGASDSGQLVVSLESSPEE